MKLMLDFETLATTPDTVVLTLGAALFDREKIHQAEQWAFDVEGQLRVGRRVEFSTLQWWMKQEKAAQTDAFFNGERLKIFDFFDKFIAFVLSGGEVDEAWSNGADFDLAIIRSLHMQTEARGYQKPLPWKFWSQRCYRTIKASSGCDKLVLFDGVKHNAKADAIHQAQCLIALWNKK